VLFVEGRLGHDTAAELEAALLAHTSKVSNSATGTEFDTSAIAIDLSGVDYLSGAALRVFKSIADRQSESGGSVRLRAPSVAARFALELSGLLELVD